MSSEPMSGLPADTRRHGPGCGGQDHPGPCPGPVGLEDTPDLTGAIEDAKETLRAAVRGDDRWRHPDLYDDPINTYTDYNLVASAPEIYTAAHAFMAAVFGEDAYTPDSIGQLVEVFVPCLRLMNDRKGHPWPTDGAMWRKGGMGPVMIFLRAKFARYWYRTWIQGKRHDDSGYDGINFWAFSLRADPNNQWGELGEPANQKDM